MIYWVSKENLRRAIYWNNWDKMFVILSNRFWIEGRDDNCWESVEFVTIFRFWT